MAARHASILQREVGDSVTTGSGSCGCLGGKDGAGKHQRSHALCHPLLRMKDAPPLRANKDTVLPNLRGTEKHLSKDPEKAKTYEAEIQKLLDAWSVVKLPPKT